MALSHDDSTIHFVLGRPIINTIIIIIIPIFPSLIPSILLTQHFDQLSRFDILLVSDGRLAMRCARIAHSWRKSENYVYVWVSCRSGV